MKKLIAFVIAGLCAVATPEGRPQVFRTATHAVAVDVAVFDGDRAVPALGPSDFEIADNGVPQTPVAADPNSLPIDLRLVFDTSGSITEADLDRYRRAMRRVTDMLRPEDRCEIVSFTTRVADAARRQSPPVSIDLRRSEPDGTSFFDAVSLALVTVPAVNRRQVTIVLSDAQDNASFFDETTLLDIARRTDAVVYTVLSAETVPEGSPFVARLQSLSLLTGGRLVVADRDAQIGATLIDAIEEFRRSYVLRYVLHGVPLVGWHKLNVKVHGPRRYAVRARAGYFGG
jgi:hypothetical protein